MRELYFTHSPGHPTRAIWLNFGMRGHIADIITYTNFCQSVQRFLSSDTPNFVILHRNSLLLLQSCCKHYHATL